MIFQFALRHRLAATERPRYHATFMDRMQPPRWGDRRIWWVPLFGGPQPWKVLLDERPILSGRHPLHLYHGYLGSRAARTRQPVLLRSELSRRLSQDAGFSSFPNSVWERSRRNSVSPPFPLCTFDSHPTTPRSNKEAKRSFATGLSKQSLGTRVSAAI